MKDKEDVIKHLHCILHYYSPVNSFVVVQYDHKMVSQVLSEKVLPVMIPRSYK